MHGQLGGWAAHSGFGLASNCPLTWMTTHVDSGAGPTGTPPVCSGATVAVPITDASLDASRAGGAAVCVAGARSWRESHPAAAARQQRRGTTDRGIGGGGFCGCFLLLSCFFFSLRWER